MTKISGPRWFNYECRVLKRTTRKLLRKFRLSQSRNEQSVLLRKYLSSKAAFNSKVKEQKEKFYAEIQNSLLDSKKSGAFFKALSIFRNTGISQIGNEHVPLKAFKDFFQTVFTDPNPLAPLQVDKDIEDEILDAGFTMNELNNTLKQLSRNKAPGKDGIRNEVWINFPDEVKHILLDQLNKMYEQGELPELVRDSLSAHL